MRLCTPLARTLLLRSVFEIKGTLTSDFLEIVMSLCTCQYCLPCNVHCCTPAHQQLLHCNTCDHIASLISLHDCRKNLVFYATKNLTSTFVKLS